MSWWGGRWADQAEEDIGGKVGDGGARARDGAERVKQGRQSVSFASDSKRQAS